jgi:DNA-binding response OmpR family regulator
MPETILIVDDEPSIVAPLQFLMQRNGYRVLVAQTGEQALEIIAAEKPHVVLLDIMLPGISGFDVCRMVREDRQLDKTRIVLVTAMGHRVNMAKGLALGADAYITKPFANEAIVSKVKELLDRADETDQ